MAPHTKRSKMMETFYIVYRGSRTTGKHDDLESAKLEAASLCKQENDSFYIFKAVGKVELETPPTTFTEID